MGDFTRRKFIVVTTLAAGFLAVHQFLPKSSTQIPDWVAGVVKIPVEDGEIPAYRAMPATGRNFPMVLVVQGISWRA